MNSREVDKLLAVLERIASALERASPEPPKPEVKEPPKQLHWSDPSTPSRTPEEVAVKAIVRELQKPAEERREEMFDFFTEASACGDDFVGTEKTHLIEAWRATDQRIPFQDWIATRAAREREQSEAESED